MTETGAHVDVSDGNKEKDRWQEKDESGVVPITIRGSKKAVAAAKAAVMAIASVVDDEISVVVHVEPKYHKTIIGSGGFGLKNLLARVGVPGDSKEQAGLVRL